VPTDAYDLDEAVRDGHLVPPRVVSLTTDFLDRGISYDQLSDEDKEKWDALEAGAIIIMAHAASKCTAWLRRSAS
jgi:type I site-specific restriction endonuclease